jgi:hypothetical protein
VSEKTLTASQLEHLVEVQQVPNEIDFACPGCGLNCKTFPKTKAVIHQKPECPMWDKAKKNRDELSLFVIKGGVALAFNNKA